MPIQFGFRGASNTGLYRISNKPKAAIQHRPDTTMNVIARALQDAAMRTRAAALIRR
jgi:hypothetical protein